MQNTIHPNHHLLLSLILFISEKLKLLLRLSFESLAKNLSFTSLAQTFVLVYSSKKHHSTLSTHTRLMRTFKMRRSMTRGVFNNEQTERFTHTEPSPEVKWQWRSFLQTWNAHCQKRWSTCVQLHTLNRNVIDMWKFDGASENWGCWNIYLKEPSGNYFWWEQICSWDSVFLFGPSISKTSNMFIKINGMQ